MYTPYIDPRFHDLQTPGRPQKLRRTRDNKCQRLQFTRIPTSIDFRKQWRYHKPAHVFIALWAQYQVSYCFFTAHLAKIDLGDQKLHSGAARYHTQQPLQLGQDGSGRATRVGRESARLFIFLFFSFQVSLVLFFLNQEYQKVVSSINFHEFYKKVHDFFS